MTLTQRFDDALLMAHALHRTQIRKGSETPYIAHLLAVSSLVLEAGGDEDCAIAALLHDGPEDCGGATVLETIQQKFGGRVARIVSACTDTMETPKPDWMTRKLKYIEHLRNAAEDERLVSAADKVHNARSIIADHEVVGEAVWSRFKASPQASCWYYRAVLDALTAHRNGRLENELARLVAQMEEIVRQIPAPLPRS